MYERMLDKQTKPTMEEMTAFCGETAEYFSFLNDWLIDTFETETAIAFPYGNKYGWGVSHRIKKKLICYIFAESHAFTVMMRLSDRQYAEIYETLQDYAKKYIDNRYPCGDGGWIHYRITSEMQVADIQKLLERKCSK